MEQKRNAWMLDASKHVSLIFLLGVTALSLSTMVSAYELMPTPNLALRAVGSIYDIEVEPDGSLILAGAFDEIGGVPRKNLARILPDGSVDPNWIFDANNAVYAVARAPSGRIYLGGEFTDINGAAHYYKARIESTINGGNLDPWMHNSYGTVWDIEVAGDDDVFAIEGSSSRLFRYPGGGTSNDPDWVASKSLQIPWDLVVSADGSQITTCSLYGEIATLSREGDVAWRLNWPGACGELGVAPDGAIFAARLRDLTPNGGDQLISRIDQTGAIDPRWERSLDESVDAFAFPSNGEVWVGTAETRRSVRRPYTVRSRRGSLVRFSSNGAPLTGGVIATNGAVEVVLPLTGDRAVIAGDFGRVNATNRYAWAMVDTRSFAVASMPASPMTTSPRVHDVLPLPDGTTLISGNFVQIDGQDRRYLAQLAADGSLLPTQWSFEQPITTLDLDAAGQCFVGSMFPALPDFSDQTLLRLEACGAHIDSDWRPMVTDPVFEMEVGPDDDSSLYVAICPAIPNWVVYSRDANPCRVERISTEASGSFLPMWAQPFGEEPTDLVVDSSGLFLSRYAPNPLNLLKVTDRSTGEFDATWVPDAAIPRRAYGLAAYGGHLYVAGDWRFYEPRQDMPTLSRIGLDDGVVDTAWMGWTVSNYFSSIVATRNGFLHAAGGASLTRINVVNPGSASTSANWIRVSGGQLGRVSLTDDGDLWLTGSFRSVDGVPRIGIARLRDEFGALFIDGFD